MSKQNRTYTLDLSANAVTDAIPLMDNRHVGIELYGASNTHAGTFYVKVGHDSSLTKWSTVTLSGTPDATNGSAIVHSIDLELNGYAFVVGYTRSSGTGTATANVTIKP